MLVYYIIASFEVYLIAETNLPHVFVVLFQKSSTVQYILTPALIVLHKLTKNVFVGSKGGPTFSRGGGRTQLLIPYRTCDFQGESGPPVTPTSSLGPCMTDPSQNDGVSCLNHELSLVCIALIFLLQK